MWPVYVVVAWLLSLLFPVSLARAAGRSPSLEELVEQEDPADQTEQKQPPLAA